MTGCDDALAALLFGGTPDAAAERHLATCPRCAEERPGIERVRVALAADAAPVPPPALAARVLDIAAPFLARNARRAAWPVVARALGAALALLPVVVFVDWHLVRAIHALLATVLPAALSAYLVFNYAALLALLLALTYSAIPILAERQARLSRLETHG